MTTAAIDQARRRVEVVTALPGYTRSSGATVVDVRPGFVVLSLESRPDLLQFNGFFHGGVVTGLADHAAGGAVTTLMAPERIGVTVDLNMHFLQPCKGAELFARAVALRVGSTVATARVDVSTSEEQLSEPCAFGIVTLRAVDSPV